MEDQHFNMFINGSSQHWDISIDETIDGPHLWYAEINGPVGYFNFRIASPEFAQDLYWFLHNNLKNILQPEFKASSFDGNDVTFLWDDEFPRCFILITGKSDLCIRVEISGEHLQDMQIALHNLMEDFLKGSQCQIQL